MTNSDQWMEEMERLRKSDMTGTPDTIAFHLGYANSVIHDLLKRVEALEKPFTPPRPV